MVCCFTAGVIAVQMLPALPGPLALAGLAAPAVWPWRGRAAWAAALLGVLWATVRAQAVLDQRWAVSAHGSEQELQGRITSLPEREGSTWRFLFRPDDARFPQRIRVAWYRSDAALRGGECWRLTLRLHAPHGSFNPGGFDYEGWLFRQGIAATASVRDGQRCATPGREPVLEARQRISEAIRNALGAHPAAGLLVALAVGDQSAVAGDDWDLFRLTGTSHLVAISGFNIALVAACAFFAGRWLWALWPPLCLRWPAPRAGLACAALWAGPYALLAGFEPPVQRALVMLWIALAALSLDRQARPSRVLALAWLGVLVPDPLAVLAPGLWLSFLAVATLFYVGLQRLAAPGFWHAAVLLQGVLALALAPLSLFFFQGTSWIAPLVNLLAVPFFAVLTPWLLAALLVLGLWPAAGIALLGAAADALQGFRLALDWAAQAPEPWWPASPTVLALLLAAFGVVLVLAPRGLPLRGLGTLCLLPLLFAAPRVPQGGLEVTALDVGQGLAVVVRTARHTLLYDAGPAFDGGFDAGASVVAPYLLSQGIRQVDLLLLSHGDNDHAGGVGSVRRLLRVREELGTDRGAPCTAGRAWNWDGVHFAVLHPAVPGRGNNHSCVLRVSGPFGVLLPGDIEAAGERALLEAGGLQSDLLLAPHHGSRTSSTPAFVAAVRPAVVVHPAGWRNRFRHPRPEVQARYSEAGAAQFVTGQGGAVRVACDGAGVLQVREYRRESARYWNAPAGP